MLKKLHAIVQERAEKNAQTSTKVTQMCQLLFDVNTPLDKRKSAMNNILVLAKESAGAELIFKDGVIKKIASMMKTEKMKKFM